MTEIFLASVLTSSSRHWAPQDDRLKSFWWCGGGVEGSKQNRELKKRNEDGEVERQRSRGTERASGWTQGPDEQWAPLSSSINLVFLPLLWHFCITSLTTPPSIILLSTVIPWKLLNSMLQICPPLNNSFCHLLYIIRKTHNLLSAGRSLRIITGDTSETQLESGASYFQA